MRTLLWLNIEVALSNTSKSRTATGGYHDGELDHHRQQDLDRMETQPGRDVEFKVGVVHAMQAPQRRHRMKEDMLEINRKVEDDDGSNHADPGRRREYVQQAEAARLYKKRKPHGRCGKQNTDQQRVHRDDAKTVGPAPAAPDRLFPARADPFPDRHNDKHAAKCSQPDVGLVGKPALRMA
jgi:hypothetical protein